MEWYRYVGFSLGWALIIYLVNCAIAKEWKRVHPKIALTYFATIALIGLFGEIFLDTVYNFFAGRPLWYYQIAPLHGGYTSSFAIVAWGLYGFHFYLLHDSLHAKWRISKTKHLAFIIAIEALVVEALLTLSAKLVFGKYLYYYTPSDLWHVTSLQNMPFYFIFAIVALKTLRRARQDPKFFTVMSGFLLLVLVWTAS
jgi:hypothetical protein